MTEKSVSWVYDGPSPIDPYISDGRNQGKQNENDKIQMEVWKEGDHQKTDETDEAMRDWSAAKKGRITKWLIFCTITVTFASSIQFGYNSGCITASSPYIRKFINESQYDRGGVRFSQSIVDMLWSFTEAGFRFGGAMGAQTGAQIAVRLGRRNGLLIQNAITVVSSIMLGVTQLTGSWELLLLGRLFIGFGTGISMTIVPLYLSEISPCNHRGAIGSIHFFMFAVGLLTAQGIGLFPLNTEDLWPLSLALGGVFGLFGLLTIPFCPETPRYLGITKKADDEAENVLQNLRGKNADIKAEMDEIAYERDLERKRGIDGFINTVCCRAVGWKTPMYMAVVLLITQQFAGITAFTFNGLETWRDTDINEDMIFSAIIGSDVLMVLSAILPILTSDSFGRKRLVIYGYCSCVFFLVILVLCLSLQMTTESSWPMWGSLISIYGFIISFSSGPGCVPYVIVPEIFTQEPRAYAVGLSNQLFWFSSLVMSFLYPAILDLIGQYTFIVFIVIIIPLIILLYKYLPETKKNTFVENAALFLTDKDRQHGQKTINSPGSKSRTVSPEES